MLEEMLKKERTFKDILEKVPFGILVMDHKSKDIVLANREMEEVIANNDKDPNLTFKERICQYFKHKVVVSSEDGK